VKGNEKFNNQLQEILNKNNKNVYILLSRDLNARIGNTEIHNTVGSLGELGTNTNRLKLRDFASYNNNIKIMNSFYKHNTIPTYTWSASNCNIIKDYLIANSKLSKLFLEVRLYRVNYIDSDYNLTLAKLRFTPKLLHLPKNTARKETPLHYKISLLSGRVYNGYTKNSTRATINSRKQQYCFGIEEHQNYKLTGSRRTFRNIQTIYTKGKKMR
jgi:hypothetical protein